MKKQNGTIDVSLRLNWEPQTENAGFFIACWCGFYEELGLRVKLELPDPDRQVAELVSSGINDFGLAEPVNVVLARSNGYPIVSIMQIQHDAYLRYIAKKTKGIERLEDVKGKTVSLWLGGGEFEFIGMLNSVGLTTNDVTIVAQPGGTMAPFFEEEVDVASATLFNELQVVYENGYSDAELTTFYGKDFGVGLVAKGLFTTEKMIEERPDIVQAFVTASIRGWQYAYYHPQKTAQLFVENYPYLDYDKMLTMMNGFNQLNTTGLGKEMGLGYIDRQYFVTAMEVMSRAGLLKNSISIDECFNLTFWENTADDYKKVS